MVDLSHGMSLWFRIEIFRAALERIHVHNCEADMGAHAYHCGLNELSDLVRNTLHCVQPVNKMRLSNSIAIDLKLFSSSFSPPKSRLLERADRSSNYPLLTTLQPRHLLVFLALVSILDAPSYYGDCGLQCRSKL